MTRIELTISTNYVPSWTIVDAIRELFQNALDQEVINPEATMTWEYDPETQLLRISNKGTKLTTDSLLLGATAKTHRSDTIGQFGEGYKIAALVLLRNNKAMKVHNCGELWEPKLVESPNFNTKVLTFFISKPESPIYNDLTIEIGGLTKEEFYSQIVPSNLHLLPEHVNVTTPYKTIYGAALANTAALNENLRGRVYVNGLYVLTSSTLHFGYNINPQYITLDRDRKTISDFNLHWLTSQHWANINSLNMSVVFEMLEQGAPDVMYLQHTLAIENLRLWADTLAMHFTRRHGERAVPVTSQEALEAVPRHYRGVLVSTTYSDIVRHSQLLKLPSAQEYEQEAAARRLARDTVLSKRRAGVMHDLGAWVDSVSTRYFLSAEDLDAIADVTRRLEELFND